MIDEKNGANQLYDALTEGGIDERTFQGKIFRHILTHHKCYGIFEKNEDDNSDFLTWVYPRLSRALNRYEPRKDISFDAFLHTIIRLAYKEYKTRVYRRGKIEKLFWKEAAIHSSFWKDDSESSYENSSCVTVRLHPKQTLMVLLKSYNAVSDELITRAAPVIGRSKEDLTAMIDELRKQRLEQDSEFHDLCERCYSQYVRCLSYERRLSAAEKDTPQHRQLTRQAGETRLRLARMRRRLKNMRIEASNRQVAAVMGIPKGSVDSGLNAFRRKYCSSQQAR